MTPLPRENELELKATLNSLTQLSNALRAYLQPLSVPESWIYPLDLALCEAASNIIRHGYGDIKTRTYYARFDHNHREVSVTLRDNGKPIPPENLQPAPLDETIPLAELSSGGRGMFIIFNSVDRVEYQRGDNDNRLLLVRRLPTG